MVNLDYSIYSKLHKLSLDDLTFNVSILFMWNMNFMTSVKARIKILLNSKVFAQQASWPVGSVNLDVCVFSGVL